jgi:hypothetical protein
MINTKTMGIKGTKTINLIPMLGETYIMPKTNIKAIIPNLNK